MNELAPMIAAARRHLGWSTVRAEIRRRAPVLCGAVALCAAARPLLWPLRDGSPWMALARAALLALGGAGLVLVIVTARAWRSRPTLLASARKVDEALGLAEVVASGYAFERDGRDDPMTSVSRAHACRALEGVTLDRVLEPPKRARSRSERGWFLAAAAAAGIGLAVGGIDRVLVDRTLHPITTREAAAAAELAHAVEAAAQERKEEKNPQAEALVDAARRASDAAKRGDRKGAREAIEDARAAARALEADEREQARALRSIRDEIDSAASAGEGRRAGAASEAMAKLAKELDGHDKEALRKVAESLERAARSAEGKSKSGSSWSRAASALAEAREAAARGDKDAAKRALERARRELEGLEKRSGSESAMTRIADGASALDRSMHAATSSAGSGDGEKGGKGESKGAGEKASEKSSSEPSGTPGTGPGTGDRGSGPEQRRLKVNGDLKARTDVREGERAVSAIEGMGRGDDPRAYREIFPSYDTVVEDGLREDAVPAARRPTVRRYFSSIRPGEK